MSAAAVANGSTAIPHRKQIRGWLLPHVRRSTALALLIIIGDLALMTIALWALVALAAPLAKLIAGLAVGVLIARLFVIGHDACHHSLTRRRRLNAVIGRIAFLPSLTPYSLWDVGHNVVHHGYTNLKDFDFIWQPMTRGQFLRLPAWRRALERLYRGGFAPGLYYLVEVWWNRLYFPNRRQMPTRRAVFTVDGLLVTAFASLWIAGLAAAARATGQSAGLMIGSGFVLPFLVWNWVMGFIVYVHHTHPAIAWHAEKSTWSRTQPFVSTTVHLRFRRRLGGFDAGALLHHITEHTAHHVDMSIPLYRLRKAQALLESRLPGVITVQDFSWRWYLDTARRCKLYDFDRGCWTDFEGGRTA